MNALRSLLGLAASVLIVSAVAAVGALFMPGEWYAALEKPAWNPPNWIFGPVWSMLYLAMAVAAWLVWRQRAEKPVGPALGAFGIQLVLNGLWSWIFFGLHLMGVAFFDICALAIMIVVTMLLFWRISRVAAFLLLPYLCWVLFASVLNFTLWMMNT